MVVGKSVFYNRHDLDYFFVKTDFTKLFEILSQIHSFLFSKKIKTMEFLFILVQKVFKLAL